MRHTHDRPVHLHKRMWSTHTTHTRIHHDHTCIAAFRSCKTEESLKRLLLPCRFPLQRWPTCAFSIVLVGSSSAESNPVILPDFVTLNAHAARPGPKLATWCTGGPPACPACPPAESTRKDPRVPEKILQM